MNLARREKYSGQGRTVSFTRKTINVNFSLDVLNIMSSYVLSQNANIKRGQLINMRNLFDIINVESYTSEPEKMKRLNFIRKGLEGRIGKGLNNPVLITKYINGGISDVDNSDIPILELSNEEIAFVNQSVSTTLKFSFINNDVDRLQELCTRYKAADYENIPGIVNEFEQLISEIQAKFRRVKVENMSEMTFSLANEKFEAAVEDVFNQITNPRNKLITGMQGLNEMLGGGFESGREYLFLGLAGAGKSMFLLDLAVQMKKYNKNYQTKDPTKRPVIAYLTMENSEKETVQRLFEMVVGKGEMKDYTLEEVIHLLRTEGELYLTDESPVDIIIKYKPNESVDTSYLYTMTEDLEDEGYEVICVLQDHVKRIRPVTGQSDMRLRLGDVTNEMHSFAVIKDIPIITVSHLNRDAARNIDEGAKSNKSDLLRLVGRSNIGESLLMMDNVDGMFLLAKEYDKEGNKYIGLSRTKERFKCSTRALMYFPFENPDSIKMIEDQYCQVPIFRETLRPNPTETNLFNNGIKQSPYQPEIKSIDDLLNNDNNPFTRMENNMPPVVEENTMDFIPNIQPSNDTNKLITVMEKIDAPACTRLLNNGLMKVCRRVPTHV